MGQRSQLRRNVLLKVPTRPSRFRTPTLGDALRYREPMSQAIGKFGTTCLGAPIPSDRWAENGHRHGRSPRLTGETPPSTRSSPVPAVRRFPEHCGGAATGCLARKRRPRATNRPHWVGIVAAKCAFPRVAKRLVNELRVDEFDPTKHHDAFRERLEQAAREKAKGRTIEVGAAAPGRAPVIDLIEALQESLRKPPVKAGARRAAEASARSPERQRKTRKRGAA